MTDHPTTLPESVQARVLARCGRLHPFAEIDPARTALLVIDMQNGYMRADVGHAVVPSAPGIVPAINRMAAALRDAGGLVVWVQNASDERSRREWSVLEAQSSPQRRAARIRSISPGAEGHRFWPDLDQRKTDLIMPKYRYSCFIQGASDIEATLRARGIDTLLIAGTLTNVCCESTARDAAMLNFRTIMLADANAAMSDAEHLAALSSFHLFFGDVQTVDQATAALRSCEMARAVG